MSEGAPEFTIDELAARAGMTVRNVRAYAGRGLIEPPRLAGRTGYYSASHLQRLQLVRELLDRGYTLSAVEEALLASPATAASHTLDLLTLLDQPRPAGEPEVMTRDALAALARVSRDDALIDSLADQGLVEWIDDDHDHVRLLDPAVVRAGTAAAALGLDAHSVIDLYPLLSTNLRQIADEFVRRFAEEIVEPFVDAGLPEDQWGTLLATVENILPVALQVTMNVFRSQLNAAIDAELGEQIATIAERLGAAGDDGAPADGSAGADVPD